MFPKKFILSIAILASFFSNSFPASAQGAAEFKIRGTLPWHNFLSGPTAWNWDDYKEYLDWMAELDLNFVGFHCYTGGSERYVNYVEPLIRVQYRNVLPAAELDTSITSRWGYWPLTTDRFLFGTSRFFSHRIYGADIALEAKTQEERYVKAQALMQRVVDYAHEKGIRVALGFEFGIYPPEFFSIVPPEAMLRHPYLPDPTHPANIEILQLYIRNLRDAYPNLDYVWFWLQEIGTPVEQFRFSPSFQKYFDERKEEFLDLEDPTKIFNAVWSLAYIEKAYEIMRKEFPDARMAISGWGGGNQLPPLLPSLHRALPQDIIFSCLSPAQGLEPQPAVMGEMPEREVWIIPWLEGDQRLWHPQPRASLLKRHVQLARLQEVDGIIGIHWRTQDIQMNFDALSLLTSPGVPKDAKSNADEQITREWTENFYREWCAKQYGEINAERIAPFLARMDFELILEPRNGEVSSPEYFPYEPRWGRLSEQTRDFIGEFLQEVSEMTRSEPVDLYLWNLKHLEETLRFVLLLDEVGRQLEPAYRLKNAILLNSISPDEKRAACEQALDAIEKAPLRELFMTFHHRERTGTRGELGVLSSLNQKLGSFVLDLQEFLSQAMKE